MLIYKIIMMILMGKLMEGLMKLGYSQFIKLVFKEGASQHHHLKNNQIKNKFLLEVPQKNKL